MNNDNTVKIGVALKWRNTFDTTKRYYQENVVTACGCVFRCKVLQAQGKSPIRFTDEQGHIAYTNTDVWDVLVDMAYYYNYTVDTRKLTQEMLDYAKKLDEAFQKQQKEIAALQKDNKDQWSHINDIEKINVEQQRELNSIHDTISCFSEGIWIDTLLWSNVTIWDNNKYAITDDLQDQINVLTENHNQDIEDLTDKHNSELSTLTASIINQNKIQDGINNYLQDQVYDLNNGLCCFGSGVWENDLHWSQEALWDNNKYAITDALAEELETLTANHNKDVKNINAHLLESDQELAKAVLQNASEHRLVNDHLDKHDNEIEALQTLIKEHDQQIVDLIDTLACFSYGYWDDGLKWSNQALWENSNLMYDTFEDIYGEIAKHQQSIEDLTKEIQKVKTDAENTLKSINKTFDGFRKEHEGFRKEHEEFSKEHEGFRKEHKEITDRLDSHDTLCEEQQREIDSLLYRISILTNGVWDNALLWNNDSEWSNTDLNGSCHCPEDTEERLDELKNGLETVEQRVSDAEENIEIIISDVETNASVIKANTSAIENNASEIENIKQNAIIEHRSVAYQLRAIGRDQAAQDENLAKLGEHFSCYADGVWGDLFIWDNDLLWANQTGVVNEALTDLRNNLRDTRDKLNEANEDIMTNLSLIQANHQLIEGNTAAIQENKDEIESTQSDLQTVADEIRKEALAEHRQVAYQLRAIGRDQEVQNENIAKLGEHFSCFADGVWGNLFSWDNDHLWANAPGVIESAIDDIHTELNSHQKTLDSIIEEKNEHFSCFHDNIWCNSSVWSNDHHWPLDIAGIVDTLQKHELDINALRSSTESTQAQLSSKIVNLENGLSETNDKVNAYKEQINANTKNIDNATKCIEELKAEIELQSEELHGELMMEHRQVAYQLRAFIREQNVQDEHIAQIGTHFSCFVDGIWGNHFLWGNDHLWANAPGVIDEAINDINTVIDRHQETLNLIMEEQADHFACFSDDVWCNSSVWDNGRLWPSDFSNFAQAIQKNENNIKAVKESVQTLATQTEEEIATITEGLSQTSENISEILASIQSHQSSIEENTQKINDNTENIQNLNKSVDNLQTQAVEERREIAYQLRAFECEQVAQDENLAKFGEHFGCFVDGKWCDLFLWNNGHLWHNEAGFTEEAIADTNERIDSINNEIDNINQRAEEHQSEYQEMLDDIRSYNGCFERGEWANPFFWNDTDKWYNSPDVVSETETEIISHDHRLTALESQFALFLQQFAVQQTIIEQQKEQLETLMDCFTVLNVGKWQNLLLWDNNSKWSNALITETTSSIGTGGASTVSVKSYDPDTATVTI